MKKNKFLGIFALIIFILLILIMFILPDSLFLAIENTKTPMLPTGIKNPSNTKQEKTIADKFTQLKTTEYNYEYSLMYSENNETYTYKCTGTINGTKEKGNCTSPEEITYTEENKKEILNKIDTNLINNDYIYSLIKDIKPEETKISLTTTEYKYETIINKYRTDITITSNINDITQIVINNVYMTYIINYKV